MKLVSALLVAASVVLGIAACAAPAAEDREEVGENSQALCMKGQICTGSSSGFFGGSSGVLDPGTSTSSSGSSTTTITCGVPSGGTFHCSGKVVICSADGSQKPSSYPCDMTVRNYLGQYDCVPGCGGGGWSFGGWNPCMYGRTYTCDSNGYCRCS